MRSRPDITLYLSPRAPAPGQQLNARVRLDVRSETPCAGVVVTLRGSERRYRNTSSTGKTSVTHYHRREVLSSGLRCETGTLRPGVWQQDFPFVIPVDATPSYRSPLSEVAYRLDVRVEIPWWPDAHEVFDVIVAAPSHPGRRGHARAVTNVQGDRRGEGVAMELSLAEDATQPGGALRGALALSGLGGVSLRKVELALVAVESPRVYSSAGPREVDRRVWLLREGTPGEGEAMRFDLAVPPEMPAAMLSPFIEVTHHVEATAVVAWGSDVSVHLPVFVAPGAGDLRSDAVPVVGRARSVAVWQQAVRETTIPGATLVRFEPEVARVVFSVGGLKVLAREEQRGDAPVMVAEITLADLGLDLRVAERSWTDLGARIPAVDGPFQQRFTVRAREAAQAAAMLDPAVRESLSRFDEAGLDDVGAVAMRVGGVFQLAGLQRFLYDVQCLAAALAAASSRLPPPAALADRAEAFASFARARGARLRVGDLSLHDWAVRGLVMHTALRWQDGAPHAIALCLALPEGADAARWRDALHARFDARAEVEGGVVWVDCALPRDPASLQTTAEALTELAASLGRGGDVGPYRR